MSYLALFIIFIKLFFQSINAPSIQPNFNFLILGLDPRNDSLEKTETTDTIIFARLNSNWQINLVSLPRDLWYYPLDAKINQIYPKSIDQPNQFSYIQNNFSDLTSLPIDRSIIITTQNLQAIADIIGGVDVYLENGFTDSLYPNPEYIINPSPDIPIYITVSYPQGWNHLNSSNIAPFVRSRHSAETAAAGGTDLGRIVRQQLLLDALIKKIRSPVVIKNPSTILSLYNYWHQQIKTNFSDLDFISLLRLGYKNINQLSINKFEIPTGENPQTDIIYHPKTFINPQWVFIPQDSNYKSLQNYIRKQFAILN